MMIALVSSFPLLAKASFYAIGLVCALAVFEIFLEEIALLKHFGELYSHLGRYVIMLAIAIGWVLGLKFSSHETMIEANSKREPNARSQTISLFQRNLPIPS